MTSLSALRLGFFEDFWDAMWKIKPSSFSCTTTYFGARECGEVARELPLYLFPWKVLGDDPRLSDTSNILFEFACPPFRGQPRIWQDFLPRMERNKLSNEKNLGWLGDIGDYATQLYRAL